MRSVLVLILQLEDCNSTLSKMVVSSILPHTEKCHFWQPWNTRTHLNIFTRLILFSSTVWKRCQQIQVIYCQPHLESSFKLFWCHPFCKTPFFLFKKHKTRSHAAPDVRKANFLHMLFSLLLNTMLMNVLTNTVNKFVLGNNFHTMLTNLLLDWYKVKKKISKTFINSHT